MYLLLSIVLSFSNEKKGRKEFDLNLSYKKKYTQMKK